jgi:cytochrome c oxidase subunit II
MLTTAGQAAPRQQSSPRVIRISAERFSFTPSEIRMSEGEEVELRIASEDTAHGFRLVGTGLGGTVPKRGKGELRVPFRPTLAGRYTFECSRMCGAGHDFMRGVVIVRPREMALNTARDRPPCLNLFTGAGGPGMAAGADVSIATSQ